jgi:hypothetical protein
LQAQITQKKKMLDDLGANRERANTTYNYDSVRALEQAQAKAREDWEAAQVERMHSAGASKSAAIPTIKTPWRKKGRGGMDSDDEDTEDEEDDDFHSVNGGTLGGSVGGTAEQQLMRIRAATHSSPSEAIFQGRREGQGGNTERAKSFVMFTDKLNSER